MTSAAQTHSRMSIGEVLERLRVDFPEISISKIRYLESEGLVEPERTPAGYRKFSETDVERLRYVLICQREHFLPLRVIREHLEAIDRGLEPPQLPGGGARVPSVVLAADNGSDPDAFKPDSSGLRMSRAELIEAAGISPELLDQIEGFGLVRKRPGSDQYDGDALVVARTVGEMASFGLEPRHLRSFRIAADREVGLVEQVVTPLRRQRDTAAKARAEEAQRQLAALSVRLHATLVKTGLGGS